MSYSAAFMERHGVVLLDESVRGVTVGIASEPTDHLRRSLQCWHARRVTFRTLSGPELLVAQQRAAAESSYVRGAPEGRLVDRPMRAGSRDGVGIARTVDGVPAVNLVNSLLNDAVQRRASDIHVEASDGAARVRYRIDGVLREVAAPVSSRSLPSVATRLKALAGLNTAERRRPQDGRFTALAGADGFDVRFSSMPTIEGESFVLRLFPRRSRALGLDELGMPEVVRASLAEAVRRSSGFVLICGPTGSGKTTTLHAALARMCGDGGRGSGSGSGGRKIVTIEDPVEYRLAGVQQIQTNEAAGLTFDALLRRVLRQDPDVIMVGEIRDNPTAVLAVRAAATGHLVLATVHSRDTDGVIERLLDLGADAATLRSLAPLVLAQRLVRLRCGECGGSGCDRCLGTGYHGRTGIFEMRAADGRALPFEADAREKVRLGLTTREEATWAIGG